MKTRNYGATIIYRNKKLENLGETSISFSSTSTGGTNARLCFKLFDANGNILTSSNCNFPIGEYNEFYDGWYYDFSSFGDLSITFTMPINVAFWKLGLAANADTGYIITFTNIQVEQGRTVTPYEQCIPSIKMLAEDVDNVHESLDDYGMDNKCSDLVNGYYNADDGSLVTNYNPLKFICSTNFYHLKKGETIRVNCNSADSIYLAIYNIDDVFMNRKDYYGKKDVTYIAQDNIIIKWSVSFSTDIQNSQSPHIGVYINNVIDELKNDLSASNAGAHNCVYRGKYLGNALTTEQKAQISAGTFNDLYIGDYWTIGGVNYRIAAFDYWLNSGDTQCTKHHVVIVPDTGLYNAQMNTTNVTTGAYIGSEMYTTNLEQAKTIINNAFGSENILSHREYLPNAIKAATDPTYESAGSWYDSTVELMNERMVYGADVFHNIEVNGAIPMNYTIDKSQLPLFALEPSRICNRVYWWLRDVVSAAYFASVAYDGFTAYNATSNSLGVRPAFGITSGAASYNVSDSDSDDVSTTFGITG